MTFPTGITSTDNPRIKAVVRLLREHRERRRTGLFVAEGRRQIQRAMAADLVLHELYHCPGLATPDDFLQTLPHDLQTLAIQVSEPVMRKMAYRENPEDVLAVFSQPQASLTQLDRQLESAKDPKHGCTPLFLVAMGTSKPGNLGAMARTAAAAGCTALLVADAPVDAFNPNAIHASTGAVFRLPVVGETSAAILAFLKRHRITLIAAVVQASQSYTEVWLTGPTALIIGAEDRGLDENWRQAAQELGRCVTIPMADSIVDSLNASNAAAILLFEALRQRRQGSSNPPS